MSIFSRITARQVYERRSPKKPNVALGSLIMYSSLAFMLSQLKLNFIWFYYEWAVENVESEISEPQLIVFITSSILVKWLIHLIIGFLYMFLSWFFLRGLPPDTPKRLWQNAYDEAKLSKNTATEFAYYVGDIIYLVIIGFVLGFLSFLVLSFGAFLIGAGIAVTVTSNVELLVNILGIVYFLLVPLFLVMIIRSIPPIEVSTELDEYNDHDQSSEGFDLLKRKDPVNWDDQEDQPISCQSCGTMFNPSLKRCPLCFEQISLNNLTEVLKEEEKEE
ncbi:MAG: hypothetical protein ACTSYA_11780 [Candidatus Kariarchaeaceae archaeon]